MSRPADFSLIRLYSERLGFLTRQFIGAQQMSGLSGHSETPWGIQFQAAAAREYVRRLPTEYLAPRAAAFRACASEMARMQLPPTEISEDWKIVRSNLANLAASLELELDLIPNIARGNVEGEVPTTPSIIRFEELAALVTQDSLDLQLKAANTVAEYAVRQSYGGVTSIGIDWLRALATDLPVVDLAVTFGFSTRSMHRRLANLWKKLQVEGRTDGLERCRCGIICDCRGERDPLFGRVGRFP